MYRPRPEEFDDIHVGAGSVEPMPRADHKAKKRSRPKGRERRNKKIKGGHFVFRRGGRTGRIKTGHIINGAMPFEHPSIEAARTEADRLQKLHGGRYDVLSVSAIVDGEAADEDWDRAPVIGDEWNGREAA